MNEWRTRKPGERGSGAVARTSGPGRSLAFNGHLDTYVVGDPQEWSLDPFSGEVRDGRIHGRGACDMKGGIACSLLAFKLLAARRDAASSLLDSSHGNATLAPKLLKTTRREIWLLVGILKLRSD